MNSEKWRRLVQLWHGFRNGDIIFQCEWARRKDSIRLNHLTHIETIEDANRHVRDGIRERDFQSLKNMLTYNFSAFIDLEKITICSCTVSITIRKLSMAWCVIQDSDAEDGQMLKLWDIYARRWWGKIIKFTLWMILRRWQSVYASLYRFNWYIPCICLILTWCSGICVAAQEK